MQTLAPEDPEPHSPRPAGPLFVPVRHGSAGGCQLRFLRTPLGARTAVGFTSSQRLAAVLGERQAWIRLAEPALRVLAEPLGVVTVTIDPQLTASAASAAPAVKPWPGQHPCARVRDLADVKEEVYG
ncbi:SAV_915 family protein [Streptomyces beijiangensis]|uniref:SAV_915 family protein n=1 Tax=Streptomyces beijiangensis TaxID=163361 RepID=UPI001F5CFB6E|nr:SAV_915 family protein [Streptomyces beijiangensis]